MKKNFLYTALGLMGIMGALSIGVVNASVYSVIRSDLTDNITITYDANGGIFSGGGTTKSVEYSKNSNGLYMANENAQAPNKDGYMFAGWYTTEGEASTQTTEWYGIQTDTTETTKTVYAKWLPYTNKTVDLGEIGSFDIMDRNMGAEAVSDGLYNNKTANQLGYYYQWGNNYGFKNSGTPNISDGNQIDITGKGYGSGNYYSSATFAKRTASPYRWDIDTSTSTYTSYGNLNLWGGENTSNPDSWRQGPCPEGYHVPDTSEWNASYELFKSWANTSEGQTYCSSFTDDNATYEQKCFAAKLGLPFAGNRNDGNASVNDQGRYGYYWSSSPNPSNANYSYSIYFDSSNVIPKMSYSRAIGFSVRCFKNSSTKALTFSRNGETIDTKNVRRWEPITTSYEPATPLGTTETWYTDSELTSPFTFGNSTYVTEPKILYSKISCSDFSYIWNGTECVQQFTVTLNATTNGGTITPTSVTVANGTEFHLENYIAEKEGYTFEGWAETSGTTGVLTQNPTITANKILYAVFSKDLTATYLSGVGVASIGANFGDCTIYNIETSCTVTAPTITPKDGYDGGSWSSGSTTVNQGSGITLTADDTYTANASLITYNIDYELNSGTVASANPTIYTIESGDIKLTDPTRIGYNFEGWTGTDRADLFSGNYVAISSGSVGDREFVANWEAKIFTITLTGEGITSGTTITVTYDDTYSSLPTPTRNGFVFSGWYDGGNNLIQSGDKVKIIEDTIFTALWKVDANNNGIADENETRYTVTYTDGVDGEEIFADQKTENILSGADTPTFTGTPTRSNYVFSGWTPSVTEKVTDNATYTAQWADDANGNGENDDNEEYFTLEFTGGANGTLSGQTTWPNVLTGLTFDEAGITIPQVIPGSGKVFSGWNPEITGGTVITQGMTITPIYAEDANGNGINDDNEQHFTLEFTGGDNGTLSGQATWPNVLTGLTFDEAGITIPEVIPNSGKVFSGWNPEITGGTVITTGLDITPIYADDANGNGENDDNEQHFTLEFTGGTNGTLSGQAIWQNVLTGLIFDEAGITIPQVIPGSGKVFSGWNPEITGGTVITTGLNITPIYADDANGNGINDDNEQHFTLEFTGGANGTLSGQATWPNVLTGLTFDEAGITIPEPIPNNGYVFGGWTPKTPTSGDVVSPNYSVIWKVDANHNGIADDEESVNPASGGSGGGSGGYSGGGRKTDSNNSENKTTSGNVKNTEDKQSTVDDSGKNKNEYSSELVDAYTWAKGKGITTMPDIQTARLYDTITRAELAKMMVVFMSEVLHRQPVITETFDYPDVNEKALGDLTGYIQLAYQYQIMGINADGKPLNKFNPRGKVSRAEFATVLSRVLYGSVNNQKGANYREKHIEALNEAGILTNTDPKIQELRGWIILMLYRSLESLGK